LLGERWQNASIVLEVSDTITNFTPVPLEVPDLLVFQYILPCFILNADVFGLQAFEVVFPNLFPIPVLQRPVVETNVNSRFESFIESFDAIGGEE
jgi:hypothetical protein